VPGSGSDVIRTPMAKQAADSGNLGSATELGESWDSEGVRSILESIEGALFVVSSGPDGTLRLEEFNDTFSELFVVKRRVAGGTACYKALPVEFICQLTNAARRCSVSGRPDRFGSVVRVERKSCHWEFVLAPVNGFVAGQRRMLGHGRDVTGHHKTTNALKRITNKLLSAQDDERRRIARELHDSTAQHLVVLGISVARLQALSKQREDNGGADDAATRLIADMRITIENAHNEIRTLSLLLHPPVASDTPVADALRRFVASFAQRTGIEMRFSADESPSCSSPDVARTIMRIAQESLINVYRHAGATRVKVKLGASDEGLVLEVEDNGKGFPFEKMTNGSDDVETIGVGLLGMRARVEQLNGTLLVGSGRRGGASIRAVIPQPSRPAG
jgi:two-component system NarL family sensor kinase